MNADSDQLIPENLRVAAASDILDSLGHRDRAMASRLRPLDPLTCRFHGRARTWQWMDCDFIPEDDPYGLQIEAVDLLRPGDVVVHSTLHRGSTAVWGELLSTAAIARGARGIVCDGLIRDCAQILELGLPVFHCGIKPVDNAGRARLAAIDIPIKCGEVLVNPGDLVFADLDGVVVLPRSAEEHVVELALKKLASEQVAINQLAEGESLRDVCTRTGVL